MSDERYELFQKKMIAYNMYKSGISFVDMAALAGVTSITIKQWVSDIDSWMKSDPINSSTTLQEDLKRIMADPSKWLLKKVFVNLRRWKYGTAMNKLTYEDLAKLTYKELSSIRGIGKKSIDALRALFVQKEIKNRLSEEE